LTFVKRSVREIVRILSETETKEDRTLLADFFSLPIGDLAGPRPTGPDNGSDPPAPPRPTESPVPVRVHQVQGGFGVFPGDRSSSAKYLEIRAAYDVRRGNPLKKYRTSDFQLESPPIRFEPPPKGLEILEFKDNRVLVEVVDPNFSLHITGFDPRRDLYVKVEPTDNHLADSTL
jgi:hypothetical protein